MRDEEELIELLKKLYVHYYNPSVDYFRDCEGHDIWEEVKNLEFGEMRNILEKCKNHWK